MRRALRKVPALVAGLAAMSAAARAENAADPAVFSLTNPRAVETREIVSVAWQDARARVPGITKQRALVVDATGAAVATQVVDGDGDGTPEELLFAAQLAAGETKRYLLTTAEPPVGPGRVGARYAPEHRSDIAWENERMAFRLYGPGHRDADHAGGIDVWSKRTREPVLANWYQTGPNGDYEVDQGQGCDATKIGAGPGCGATAYLTPAGDVVMSPVFKTWKIRANGPLRAEVELVYHPVQVGAASITETRRISYDLGAPVFRIVAEFAVTGEAGGIRPLAGLKCPQQSTATGRVVTTWFSADKGEAVNGRVGLGLILPRPAAPYAGPNGTKFFPLAADLATAATWHAGATWSKGLDATTPASWEIELQGYAQRLEAPLSIR